MDSAFAIDNVTGIITTQDSFLSLEDGIYFEMEVSAKDLDKSTGYSDTTNVFVSLFHIKVLFSCSEVIFIIKSCCAMVE